MDEAEEERRGRDGGRGPVRRTAIGSGGGGGAETGGGGQWGIETKSMGLPEVGTAEVVPSSQSCFNGADPNFLFFSFLYF